jgi:hypothetical protein
MDSKGVIIGRGGFQQGFFHSFPDAHAKTIEVMDSIYNAK